MKKITLILLVISVLFASVTICYGTWQAPLNLEQVTPRYASATFILWDIDINGSIATSSVTLTPKAGSEPDRVVINASLMRQGSSTPVKSWTQTLSLSKYDDYYFSEDVKLAHRDTYYTTATLKCYRNGVLVDTIAGKSGTQTY